MIGLRGDQYTVRAVRRRTLAGAGQTPGLEVRSATVSMWTCGADAAPMGLAIGSMPKPAMDVRGAGRSFAG